MKDTQSNNARIWKALTVAGVVSALLFQAGVTVWWASALQVEVRIMKNEVTKNSSFRELWPAGRWGSGSLPSDIRQDLKIQALEKQVTKITDRVFDGGP